MATKNNPGAFDCYANALPDEPMFVLLGRDPCSAQTVRMWALERIKLGKNRCDDAQIVEAYDCADRMEAYAKGGYRAALVEAQEQARALIAAA
jgi:hypothetical protein